MKCNDCKFAVRDYPNSNHGTCRIVLPLWLQSREGDNGRSVSFHEFSVNGCDLGVLKEADANSCYRSY